MFAIGRLSVLSLLLAALLAGCAVNPVTGARELALVSEEQEVSIGNEHYRPSQQMEGGLYLADPELVEYVQAVGRRVAEHSDRALPYEFVVLNDSTPNAWALPGGKIAVNRGLLLSLESEAELAAVLGHEVVHAAARHGAQAMTRGLLFEGALALAAVGVGNMEDREVANYIVGGAMIGAQLITQKYGRDDEREADRYGMDYMVRAGYDPAAAISLQETFVRLSEGREGGFLDGLFASHPPSPQRLERNRERVAELGNPGGELGRERYGQAVAYLRSKQPAYQAHDEAQRLLAENRLQAAQEQIGIARQVEPREARFLGTEGDIQIARQRYRAAASTFTAAIERDAGYFEYYLGRGMARSRLGQSGLARSDLQRSNELLPTALAANELGLMALADGDQGTAKDYFGMAAEAGGEVGEAAGRAFVMLDLPDNPGRYVMARAKVSDQSEVSVEVENQAPVGVHDVLVELRWLAGFRMRTRTQRVAAVGAGRRMQVRTGWSLAAGMTAEDLDVRVVGAAPQR